MQPELVHVWSTPILLECFLFEKADSWWEGETDQKNLIWLPSFSRLWGRFEMSFCVSQLADGQCKLCEWAVPVTDP